MTDEEAEVLATLVDGLAVLEIGTGLGVSTRALASTARSVVTVDIDPWVWSTIWPTLPENVTGSPDVPDGVFDAAFIDGDHDTESVRRDLAAAMSVVRPDGLLIAHDTNYGHVRQGLGDGWEFIATYHGLGVRQLP